MGLIQALRPFQAERSPLYTSRAEPKNAVIPAGMQESSAMDGNLPLCKCLIQAMHKSADSHPCDWIPAVHAGMTGFDHLCITMRAEHGQ